METSNNKNNDSTETVKGCVFKHQLINLIVSSNYDDKIPLSDDFSVKINYFTAYNTPISECNTDSKQVRKSLEEWISKGDVFEFGYGEKDVILEIL
jgi:hypothetical protein